MLPPKIQQGQVYASISFVEDYLRDGTLPKIHESMGHAMDWIPKMARIGAIDFGACHGMLSLRAKKMGWGKVNGIERDQGSIDVYNQFLKTPGVYLHRADINIFDQQSKDFIADKISTANANTILARRVLSELVSTTFGSKRGADPEVIRAAGEAFTDVFLASGIRYVVLEGRAFSKRSVHPVPHTDAEIHALGPRWREAFRHKQAVVLVPA